jgi:hypothetical protein
MAHLAHHNGLDRRSFLQGLTAAGAAATLVPGTSTPARAQGENTKYETLLKGGRVVDP